MAIITNPTSSDVGKNLLSGVVTPMNQQYMNNEDGYSLRYIYENMKMEEFAKYTFPSFEKMTDGTIFVNPRAKNMKEHYYVKWLFMTKRKKNPIHNCNYPMLPLPTEGYLTKWIIPAHSKDISSIHLEYLIDIDHVDIQPNTEMRGKSIQGDQINADISSSLVVISEKLEDPDLQRLTRDFQDFANKYLLDFDNL